MSNLKVKPKTDNIVLRRDFSESNKAKFYKAMKNLKWDTIYKIENAQSAYEYFEAVILELFENFFPLRKVRLKYSNKLPWVTKGLRISIKQKHSLQNKFEKNPTEENKLLYKRHRNLLTTLMRNTERLYHENQLELNKHDLRKSWKIMKEIIGKQSDYSRVMGIHVHRQWVTVKAGVVTHREQKNAKQWGQKVSVHQRVTIQWRARS